MAKCNKCGHSCHCKSGECKECVNDVCYDCNCNNEKDIPDSFTKRN